MESTLIKYWAAGYYTWVMQCGAVSLSVVVIPYRALPQSGYLKWQILPCKELQLVITAEVLLPRSCVWNTGPPWPYLVRAASQRTELNCGFEKALLICLQTFWVIIYRAVCFSKCFCSVNSEWDGCQHFLIFTTDYCSKIPLRWV